MGREKRRREFGVADCRLLIDDCRTGTTDPQLGDESSEALEREATGE